MLRYPPVACCGRHEVREHHECGRVEPSQAELCLFTLTVGLPPSRNDRRKFATPPSGGVAPTRAVGSFRSFRPRQETWFRVGTKDWATTTLNALELSCDPQGSTVTHVHQNPDGTLAGCARKSHTIVGCGIAPYGHYHFAEATW
jgi:hypothetical protein